MSIAIKAIETRYLGHHFRSRLEARWAIYFDAAGIKWEYEHEGFVLPDETPYLPDFWLPELKCFAEVKPFGFSKEEFYKASNLPRPCILLDGKPQIHPYFVAGELSQGDNAVISLDDRYRDYLSGISFFRVMLNVSAYKRGLWFDFGDGDPFDPLELEAQRCADKANCARFESSVTTATEAKG